MSKYSNLGHFIPTSSVNLLLDRSNHLSEGKFSSLENIEMFLTLFLAKFNLVRAVSY